MAPLTPARCPPITLIGEAKGLLSVAVWWVTAVHAVYHCTSAPPGPRFKGRDATLLHHLLRPRVAQEPAQADAVRVSGVSAWGVGVGARRPGSDGPFSPRADRGPRWALANWPGRAEPSALPGKKSENSVRGELSGSSGGSGCSDAVRVSGVSAWGPGDPDRMVPSPPVRIGDPGGDGPFPSLLIV
ncbi:unnamed protein product [Boreogadus saida]